MKKIKLELSNAVQEVVDGNTSACELMAELMSLQDHIKECVDEIKSGAINDFELFAEGRKTFERDNIKFTFRSGGWVYDYSKVPAYHAKKEELKNMGEKYKALFLHAECADPETGETLNITRKPRADSYSFKVVKL